MLERKWRKRNTPPLLVGLQARTTTLEISLEVPQKTGHNTTRGPHSHSWAYTQKMLQHVIRTHAPMFFTGIFIISRSWKQPRCPSTEEWIQKMLYIYTMECYSAIENNDFMKFTSKWMELENIILSEVTQSQKNTRYTHADKVI